MNEYGKIKKSIMTALAEAIRGKTGGTELLTLDQMVTEIEGIEVGGTIPENARLYYVGNANSEVNMGSLSIESSAVGTLQEG